MRPFLIPALAAALAVSGSALAQTSTQNAPEEGTGPSDQQSNTTMPGTTEQGKTAWPKGSSYNLLTINKLTKDLENAGFTDIRVISDSFVVQAKDKNGNPTVMTLSPSGVFAISEITQNNQRQAKAGTGTGSQAPAPRE